MVGHWRILQRRDHGQEAASWSRMQDGAREAPDSWAGQPGSGPNNFHWGGLQLALSRLSKPDCAFPTLAARRDCTSKG